MPRKRTEQGTLTIAGQAVPYVLSRTRRKTLGMSVGEKGIRINVPWWVPRTEIDTFINERQRWLEKTLKQMAARSPGGWVCKDGSQITYLGIKLKVCVVPCLFDDVRRVGRVIWISSTSEERTTELLRQWLHHRAGRMLARRVIRFANKLGRTPAFALSNARTQWGICHPDGRIRLNWRLIQAPMQVIDYVAAHEVAHLVYLDHSPRFWKQVDVLFPEADNGREWLKNHGDELMRL